MALPAVPGQKILAPDVNHLVEDSKRAARAAATAASIMAVQAAPMDDQVDAGLDRAEMDGRLLSPEAANGTFARLDRLPIHASALGVVGDGVADDTATLSAAVASPLLTNHPLSLLGLDVLVSAAVDVPAGVEIVNGQITAAAATFDLLRPVGDDVTIRRVAFVGAGTASTVQYGVAADTAAVLNNVHVTDCTFRATNNGVKTGSGVDWTIEHNLFEQIVGVTAGRGYGVLAAGETRRAVIRNNRFFGAAGNMRHAVYLSVNCTDSVVTDNLIVACNEAAIVCRADVGQAGAHRNKIARNKILGGGTVTTTESAGIDIGGVAEDNEVVDNEVYDFQNIGIAVDYKNNGAVTKRNVVRGNTVRRAALTGILIQGAKDTQVEVNTVDDCSRATSGASLGIEIKSVGSGGTTEVCDGTVLSGNTVRGSMHRSALRLNSGGTLPTNTKIVGNTLLSGVLAGRAYELNGAVVAMPPGSNITDQTRTSGTTDALLGHASRSQSLDFPSIPAGTTAELPVTLAGVATAGWTVLVTPEGAPEAGLVWSAYVSAADTVTVRMANVTAAAINPAAQVFRVDCYRH